jgi:YEATS domain-containing protein 4
MAFAIKDNKKAGEETDASHKWSCYVRGPDDYDISTFIKQVVFSLHPSFNNSVRTFKSPPYEIHEEGWGEFDIAIKLHFWPDSQLRPVEFVHQLKLYPNDSAAATQTVSKKPVVNEIYHELIFTEPVSSTPPADLSEEWRAATRSRSIRIRSRGVMWCG